MWRRHQNLVHDNKGEINLGSHSVNSSLVACEFLSLHIQYTPCLNIVGVYFSQIYRALLLQFGVARAEFDVRYNLKFYQHKPLWTTHVLYIPPTIIASSGRHVNSSVFPIHVNVFHLDGKVPMLLRRQCKIR